MSENNVDVGELDPLHEDLESTIDMEPELWERIVGAVSIHRIPRRGNLLRSGDICDHGYFVLQGCLMHRYIDEDGGLSVLGFFDDEHYRFACSPSYFSLKPESYEITALEHSCVAAVGRADLERLSDEYASFGRYYRGIMARALHTFYTHTTMRLSLKPEAFLRRLETDFPYILRRIPDRHIAGFIGISAEWYSKIKSQRQS